MICIRCNEAKDLDKFFKLQGIHNKICIKCLYIEKMEKSLKIPKICPICKNKLEKGRVKFCSDECSYTYNRKNIKSWIKTGKRYEG